MAASRRDRVHRREYDAVMRCSCGARRGAPEPGDEVACQHVVPPSVPRYEPHPPGVTGAFISGGVESRPPDGRGSRPACGGEHDPDSLIDAAQLAEIELLLDLMEVASQSRHHLTSSEIDAALRIESSPASCRPPVP